MNAPEPTTMNAPGPALTGRAEWRSLSACRAEDPDLFFPAARTLTIFVQLARAKAICARCPVTDECLRYALGTGQEYGVWGGTSEEERKSMRRLVRVGSRPVLAGIAAGAGG
jgi:WhiB family transcriptional regulator, redox-sensing transcriptional regulator